jgi:hypothetical protein
MFVIKKNRKNKAKRGFLKKISGVKINKGGNLNHVPTSAPKIALPK